MPIQDGQYVPRTADDVISILESDIRTTFGTDVDLSESSVFTSIVEAFATAIAENQEIDLSDVYDSAFLETAEGEHLDQVVELVGVERRSATAATGVVRWTADEAVTQDHVIQSGTTVQTDSDEPVKFETTEGVVLGVLEDAESALTNYSGDKGSFSIDSAQQFSGSSSIKCDATSGVEIHAADVDVEHGMVIHGRVRTELNGIPIFNFARSDADNYYSLVVDDDSGRFALESTVDGSDSTVVEDNSVNPPTSEWMEFVVDWGTDGDFNIELLTENGSTLSSPSETTNTDHDRGTIGFESGDANGAKWWDVIALSGVASDVEAVEAAAESNVGANTIIVAPNFPAGPDSVTNPYPTGDSSFTDTDGDQFVPGADEEDDESLRARTEETVTTGGVATTNAILSALLQDVDSVQSVTIKENKTDADNTGSGGLPPHSFECVVLGGTDTDIAETIFEKKAVTARDFGGAFGTAVSETITATNGQSFNVNFSRPTETAVDVDIAVTTLDTYVGDEALMDVIVDYVGGTDTDGNSIVGTGVGEDVYLDEIRERVLDDENGVRSVTSLDLTDSGGSSLVVTNAEGESVVSISSTNVAVTDASDGSIAVTTTAV